MKVLIVGAGSVGQVYGHHLQRGGATVSYLVRPKYVEACRRGFTLHPLSRRPKRRAPIHFQAASILGSMDEVARSSWDLVLLCVPSDGLRAPWFGDLAKRLGEEATLVSLAPSPGDREFILHHWPAGRLVSGLITSISYPAPLPGERVSEPGTAYWLPPFTPAPFEGPVEHVAPVVEVLRRGGMPAREQRGMTRKAAYANIVLMAMVAELQSAGWSLRALRSRSHLARMHGAIREGVTIVSFRQGTPIPIPLRALSRFSLRLLAALAPRVTPFDLETYLRVHFTKVGAQTRMILAEYLAAAGEAGLDAANLRELAGALEGLSSPATEGAVT